MAASVQVLCPNGRRQNVKVTLNTKLLQVLEEVCQRQGYIPPEDYKLVQGRKELDLSLSFRFSGLTNNAKLELAKSTTSRLEEKVTIALQLDSGQRLQDTFVSSVTLWDLLLQFEDKNWDHKGKLTEVGIVDGKSSHPVCIFMREEVIGEQALKSTTLKKLALTSGKAIIRLLHRPVDDNIIADICDQVEKDKAKQVKLEEIAQKKKEIRDEEDRHSKSKSDISERLSKVEENEEQSGEDKSQRQSSDVDAMEVDQMDDVTSSSSIPSGSSLEHSSREPVSSSSRHQPHQPNPMDELRNLNIPGVEIFTPDDFNDLSPAEQAIARRLAQRFLPHLQGSSTANQASTRPGHSGHLRDEQSHNAFVDFSFPEETKGKDLTNAGSSSSLQADYLQPCDRNCVVFNASEALPMTSQEVSDDFFEVTQSDVRLMYKDLQNAVSKLEDEPLLTKTKRLELAESAFDHYPRISIRVHFPDKFVLQAFFRPRETVGALHAFVKSCLEDSSLKFYLYTTPPKTILNDMKSSLAVNHLAPAALVYFGCKEERDHYIHQDVLSNLKSRMDAEICVSQVLHSGQTDSSTTPSTSQLKAGGPSRSSSSSSSQSLPSGSKVPKWLKLSK